jgi:hypothetical protein
VLCKGFSIFAMPEVMRLMAARLRQFVGNRRSARRYEVRLGCAVRIASAKSGTNGARHAVSLEGHARDASATGLGLLMPAIHIEGHYLTGAESTLLIELELPDATTIHMQAVAVRYERVEHVQEKTSYLVGVRLTGMSEEDSERFEAYLKSLK